ncbi:MAG: YkgJ family cysteine cluster protein [Proteobacteria bacterium]|nr:YkgJ family cysteine cluster protein [Pseudomonadota bacterium]
MEPATDGDGYQSKLAEGVLNLVARLVPELDAGGIAAMMRELYAIGETTLAAVARRAPPPQPLACAAGCSYCCHLYVQVTPVEALHLAASILRDRTPDEVDAVRRRVADLDATTRGMRAGPRATSRLACALLKDGKCTAYADRPFSCRGANSFDAEDCRQMLDGNRKLTTYPHQRDIWFTIGRSLTAGIEDAGRPESQLELTAALALALAHDDPVAAWHSGALDFAPARCIEARPPAPASAPANRP